MEIEVMDAPSAPAAPDPNKTAATQASYNKDAATSQYELGATNQVTPYGSLKYSQVGTNADGTPQFQADVTQNGQPFKLGNSEAESRLDQLAAARLDPQFAREGDQLETNLINRGILPGSQAYATEHTLFNQGKNDAYNQLYLTGRSQADREALAERNQNINEIGGLFQKTPTPGVAPTDFIGAQGQSLAQQNVGFNADMANHIAMMNGMFQLGGAALGGGLGAGMGGALGGAMMGGIGSGSPMTFSPAYGPGSYGNGNSYPMF
jgi:hypothetical protein